MSNSWRLIGAAAGFGFGAVWMTVGLGPAILCLLLAAFGYGVAFMAERDLTGLRRLRPASQAPTADDEPLPLAAFELDHYERRDDEPSHEAIIPASSGAEYGWPSAV